MYDGSGGENGLHRPVVKGRRLENMCQLSKFRLTVCNLIGKLNLLHRIPSGDV